MPEKGDKMKGNLFEKNSSKKNALKEINEGSNIRLGGKFLGFAKYGFMFVTILVVILGIVYGGIG